MKRITSLRGFTLVEVLIALVIVAVGLGAAVRATTHVTAGAEQMKLRTLALWIAEDRLAENETRKIWPVPGVFRGAATQAKLAFVWRETVAATAHPAFRSIAIEVSPAEQPDYVIARLSALLPMPTDSQ